MEMHVNDIKMDTICNEKTLLKLKYRNCVIERRLNAIMNNKILCWYDIKMKKFTLISNAL